MLAYLTDIKLFCHFESRRGMTKVQIMPVPSITPSDFDLASLSLSFIHTASFDLSQTIPFVSGMPEVYDGSQKTSEAF